MQTIEVPTDKLVVKQYFRAVLNMERVAMFEAAYTSNPLSVPPIEVVKLSEGTYEIIFGRHRREAANRLGLKMVRVNLRSSFSSLGDKLLTVIKADTEPTSLPYTEDDIRMNLKALLKARVEPSKAAAAFRLPKPYIMDILHQVQSAILKDNKDKAVVDIADGLSLKEAANKRDLTVMQLKDYLKGQATKAKKRNNAGDNPKLRDIAVIGSKAKGILLSLGAMCKVALVELSNGSRDKASVIAVANRIHELALDLEGRQEDLKARAATLGG